MISLRKTLFTVFYAVAALLTLVVVLGLLQYRFTHEYDTIIYQGEKILFRFDTLREHLTRSMLSGNIQNVQEFIIIKFIFRPFKTGSQEQVQYLIRKTG